MNWFWVLLGGLLTGIFSKALLREKRYGIILTTVVGLIGGVVGNLLSRWIGYTPDANWKEFLVAVVGGVVFLGVLRLLRGQDR
jgi:uncharacterized membrane protein YeaQ/YmgE (transglycosylase-associated protein family)